MGRTAHIDTFVRDGLPRPAAQPVFLFDRPELKFPARLNAATLLDAAVARGLGEKDAVVWDGGRLAYNGLLARANRIANLLTGPLGLIPGNRVMIHGPNSADTFAIWWGVLRAGGVAVTTMPMLRAHELAQILEKGRVSHAFVHSSVTTEFECARMMTGQARHAVYYGDGGDLETRIARADAAFTAVRTAGDDPAILAFTSGTTGKPKGCVHYHRDVLAMVETFSRHILQPKADDVFCGTPPVAFTFGLGASVVFPAAAGATVAIASAPGVDAVAEAVTQHGVTTLFTAPTGYRAMAASGARLDSLHTCVSAGEHLPQATSDAWFDASGLRLIDGIGATEMIHIFLSARGDDIRPGSTGRAVPGYVTQVVDDEMRAVPNGEVGRLAVRGPTGCRYLSDDRQGRYVVDGWNLTGDLYRMDDEGRFWFVSRADDMIISSGYNIAAREVEDALLSHPGVAETAVVGVADEARGQVCKAYIVARPPAAPGDLFVRELQDHVKRAIAPYKYPRAIEFVDQLPKTHTGKLQRYRLRDGP